MIKAADRTVSLSKTAPEIERRIIVTRKENPTWGGRTTKAVLEADGSMKLPSAKPCGNPLLYVVNGGNVAS